MFGQWSSWYGFFSGYSWVLVRGSINRENVTWMGILVFIFGGRFSRFRFLRSFQFYEFVFELVLIWVDFVVCLDVLFCGVGGWEGYLVGRFFFSSCFRIRVLERDALCQEFWRCMSVVWIRSFVVVLLLWGFVYRLVYRIFYLGVIVFYCRFLRSVQYLFFLLGYGGFGDESIGFSCFVDFVEIFFFLGRVVFGQRSLSFVFCFSLWFIYRKF